MESDAVDEPPGLFTQSRMARARSSAAAARRAAVSVSEPMDDPDNGPRLLRPCRIGPVA